MNKTISVSDNLYAYLLDNSLCEPEILRRLREENASHPKAELQIAPEQGQFMRLLVQLLGIKRAIEVGVFTGYSALSVALAMPPGGRLVACDVSEEFTNVAKRYWEEAGVAQKIDFRLGPALETLDALIGAGQAASYDFVFIDADKVNYLAYYERALTLVRPGGLVAIDNTLWYGYVADTSKNDTDTVSIRALNRRILEDNRVLASLLPLADGLTLALKLA
jgi:caffeoyl-CoA O-methyltransferase